MGDLRKCSRCHSTKLENYFSYNVKGELFKTCDKCRNKQKAEIAINVARQKYINNMIESSGGDYIHLGIMNPNDVNFPTDKFGEVSGKDVLVEYHMFRVKSMNTSMIARWKLNFTDDPKKECHKHRGGTINKI